MNDTEFKLELTKHAMTLAASDPLFVHLVEGPAIHELVAKIMHGRTAPCSSQSSSEPSSTPTSPDSSRTITEPIEPRQSGASSSASSGPSRSHSESSTGSSIDDPTDAQLEALLAKREELRPVSRGCTLHYGHGLWTWMHPEHGHAPVAYPEDARANVTLRMLERLPVKWYTCRDYNLPERFCVANDVDTPAQNAFGSTPLAALYAFWSAQ